MSEVRPDPDALLQQIRADEARSARGRLRIYFGSSAGVGKTYAMLAAARKLHGEGVDVLAGVVETHGRAETQAQLQGLEVLPLAQVACRGRTLPEFDLDAALARRPALLLVDELAHSNVAGSRHPKRWQDVEELLDAGIDVYTTLNVQHLESLNDVVGGITGIRVHETLPDTFFDRADEVVLVDTPADELIERLKAGKVYLPAQAERAARHFFRKGNLMALRELSLRRTADRVEGDVQAYRVNQAIAPVWKTEAALLCCIGPRDDSDHVVRSAARLAQQLAVAWHAVYVETPALQRLPDAQRERILRTVKLAEELGATTAVLPAQDVATALVAHAREHNLSKLLMGHNRERPWWRRDTFSQHLARLAPDVDLIEVGEGQRGAPSPQRWQRDDGKTLPARPWRYLWAAAACGLTTLVALPLQPILALANIVMLFLLAVVGVALRFGRGPAVLAAFLNVAAFDFFFVAPQLSFAVSDVQYLLTFAVMLVVGLVTGQLTAGLRYQVRVATHREARSRALFELARDLSGELLTEQVVETAERAIEREFRGRARVFLQDDDGRLQPPRTGADAPGLDLGTAQWALDHAEPAGLGTDTLPGSAWLYLPLKAPMRARGVLALQPAQPRLLLIPEQRQQLETFAVLGAIALERVHYVEVAQQATVQIESERLRNSLLSALSHDLRTPLAALYGLADTLVDGTQGDAQELARALSAEARRLNAMVGKLLDMARLQSGAVHLDKQWQPIEEVVGSALRALGLALAGHPVLTDLPASLPLVNFDAALIERVLCNLLENAAKYTPAGSRVTIAARVHGAHLLVSVRDEGHGLPAGREDALFEKFVRGERESATPGVGLGLAICRAIVEAHGGRIHAERGAGPAGRPGATFSFTLPLGTPPSLPMPEEPLAVDSAVAP
ncbi:two-component system sensor histidine kinase KdpD [Methylibium sp.]|uniref:two-component system sensor histidine kinase KdpD n=1 Tax=Methylibium sp. TaxID=2067992 RepID=UPI003D0E8663